MVLIVGIAWATMVLVVGIAWATAPSLLQGAEKSWVVWTERRERGTEPQREPQHSSLRLLSAS